MRRMFASDDDLRYYSFACGYGGYAATRAFQAMVERKGVDVVFYLMMTGIALFVAWVHSPSEYK